MPIAERAAGFGNADYSYRRERATGYMGKLFSSPGNEVRMKVFLAGLRCLNSQEPQNFTTFHRGVRVRRDKKPIQTIQEGARPTNSLLAGVSR